MSEEFAKELFSTVKFSDHYYDNDICKTCSHAEIIGDTLMVEADSLCYGCYIRLPKYFAKNYREKKE